MFFTKQQRSLILPAALTLCIVCEIACYSITNGYMYSDTQTHFILQLNEYNASEIIDFISYQSKTFLPTNVNKS